MMNHWNRIVSLAACFDVGWCPRTEKDTLLAWLNHEREVKDSKAAEKAMKGKRGVKFQQNTDSVVKDFHLVGSAEPGHTIERFGRRFVRLQVVNGSKHGKNFICLNLEGDNLYLLYKNYISVDACVISWKDRIGTIAVTNIVYKKLDSELMFSPIGEFVVMQLFIEVIFFIPCCLIPLKHCFYASLIGTNYVRRYT